MLLVLSWSQNGWGKQHGKHGVAPRIAHNGVAVANVKATIPLDHIDVNEVVGGILISWVSVFRARHY